MSTKNILYICNPTSIHDLKWMRFFSEQKDTYKVFVLTETALAVDDKSAQVLKENNIILLDPIAGFSISSPLRTLKAIFKLREFIESKQIDLVHVLFASPFALWTNFISAHYIITTRGSDVLLVIPDLLKTSGLKGLYFNCLFRLFKRAFKKAKAVTCTSAAQVQKCKQLFKINNLHLIRTGVSVEEIGSLDEHKFALTKRQDRKLVFSPRFMQDIYDINLQVKALALLSTELIAQCHFIFIRGKTYDKTYLEEQINELEELKKNLDLSYEIISYLTQEELWALLKKADLCLMTPKSDGTPNSALEAMSASCPLIVPNLSYDSDLFTDTCMVLKDREALTLAQAIQNALTDYPQELKANALNAVSLFGNRPIEMKKLQDIYLSKMENIQ